MPDAIYFRSQARVTIQQIGYYGTGEMGPLMTRGKPVMLAGAGPVPMDLTKPDQLFERQDDWSSVAYFYLDRPENGLPAIHRSRIAWQVSDRSVGLPRGPRQTLRDVLLGLQSLSWSSPTVPRTLAAIFALAAILIRSCGRPSDAHAVGKVVVVKAAHLIDGVNSAPISNAVVDHNGVGGMFFNVVNHLRRNLGGIEASVFAENLRVPPLP